MRMSIEFQSGGNIIRTVVLNEQLNNLAVGQDISFDHPSVKECLSGTITRISHVVFLSDGPPLTYVDVELEYLPQ